MILLIDNYDSFTYNLYQLIAGLGEEAMVVKHDEIGLEGIHALTPTHIIISPGPGAPKDSGISRDVIRTLYQSLPILGVCLGHQCIGEVFGAVVIHAPTVMHGKTSDIYHTGEYIFTGLPSPFQAARYHSLVIDRVPTEFVRTAWTESGEIMGISHTVYPLHGVQFHPESFLTSSGKDILQSFLYGTSRTIASVSRRNFRAASPR